VGSHFPPDGIGTSLMDMHPMGSVSHRCAPHRRVSYVRTFHRCVLHYYSRSSRSPKFGNWHLFQTYPTVREALARPVRIGHAEPHVPGEACKDLSDISGVVVIHCQIISSLLSDNEYPICAYEHGLLEMQGKIHFAPASA
jgi:hypothetical protein